MMHDVLHITPRTLLFLQALVVIGIPLLIWRFASVPYAVVRTQDGHRTLRWFSVHTVFPLAIVQIFAGVLLGPSVFRPIWPDGYDFLFRSEVRSSIETIANIAIVLLVFIAGCETDRAMLRRSAGTLLKVGVTGVIVPWLIGGLAALTLSALFPIADVIGTFDKPILFSVAFGLCMSVTALPILLILCRELGINQKPIGTIALVIAGIDDILLWLSIAVILPFATGGNLYIALAVAIIGGVLLIGILSLVIAPYMAWMIRQEAPERFLMSAAILILFLSVLIADSVGLHAVVGAFVAGLLMPDKIRHMANDRLDVPVNLLLMPFFFLATGLRTEFSFNDPTVWSIVAIGLTVSIVGKLLGVSLPMFRAGQSGPFATMLGILMQCKGLMEILVITVLREKGVLGPTTFSALVLVAMISNAITSPLALLWIRLFGSAAYEARGNLQAAQPIVDTVVPVVEAAPYSGPLLHFGGSVGDVLVPKSDVVIGRHSEDDIRINDIRVSRQHARLRMRDDGAYEIINQTAVRSEPNPLAINGNEVEAGTLHDGDRVNLGGVEFVFRLPENAAMAA